MNWKRFLKALLFPPVWVIVILVAISAATLIYVFLIGSETSVFAYASYVIAFYTLSVASIFLYKVLPKYYNKAKQKIYDSRLGNKYLTDVQFRTHISLYSSLCINILYVAVHVLSYFLYKSMWFIVLAVYYAILATMRFLLLRYVRTVGIGNNRLGELKRTRLCSYILLTVNFALTGTVVMILYQNKGYEYHGILIYAMAAYTFYITTQAIINLVRYRKYNSPVMMTSKIIALSAALVSMLSLETAMLSEFGQDMSSEDKWLMIALTGAGVSVAVVAMSVYSIVKSSKEIKKIKNQI